MTSHTPFADASTPGDEASRTQAQLRERVKELTCLYGVARVLQHPELGLDTLLNDIVDLLPPAWQFPDIAGARILAGERRFVRGERDRAVHIQSSRIVADGSPAGLVEVFYVADRPEFADGAFLPEEKHLIDNVAQEIGRAIERLSAEARRQRLEEQLRHADRLATLGQLAAGVAHELNEPLVAILGFAQLLQKQPDLNEQTGRDLQQIVDAALHGRDIVKKLMIFSRQSPAERRRIDVNAAVSEALALISPRCASAKIALAQSLANEPIEIIADPAQLRQVVVNLAVNAIQAMAGGGTLKVSTRRSDAGVEIVVRDTGTGMSEVVRQRLFTPFFTTKDIGEGTGLGLSVVHGIVAAHGGTISVDSAPGEGTTFIVDWPHGGETAFNQLEPN